MMQTAHLHTITNLRALKPLLLLLILCSMSTQVCGKTAKLTLSGSDTGRKTHSVTTSDGVTFSHGGSYTEGYYLTSVLSADYSYTDAGKETFFSWTAPSGYSISVSQMKLDARMYGRNGYAQYKTSAKNTYYSTSFCSSTSWGNKILNASGYFPVSGGGSVTLKAFSKELDYKNVEITYTLTAHTYTIAFDGNGSNISGNTASVGATYDQNVTLTKNGFANSKYIITYDANGGLCKSTDSINYQFSGWAKSAGGAKEYNDGATISKPNFTSTQGGTYTLYAKWGDVISSTITLPTPTHSNPKYTFAGWYKTSIDNPANYVGIGGTTYAPTATVTLVAKWTEIKEPGFDGTDQALKVGEEYSSFIFSNTSTPQPTASSSDNFYYVITTTTAPTGNREGSDYPNDVISFDGTTIKALNNGVATIKFYQKEDAGNNIAQGESSVYTFTVTRNDHAFTWNTREHYYLNESITHFFKSEHTETAITATSNDSAIAFLGIDSTLVVCNKVGTARITVSQAENYYWAEHTEYKDITTVKKNNHVEFTVNSRTIYNAVKSYTQGNVSYTNDGIRLGASETGAFDAPAWDWGDKYVDISFEGIPDEISFNTGLTSDYATTDNPLDAHDENNGFWYMQQKSETGEWETIWIENENNNPYSSQLLTRELHADTRYVKICYTGNFAGYIKNLKVTELQYFETEEESVSLDFGTNQQGTRPADQSFVVKHANAGYDTKIFAPDRYLVSLDGEKFYENVEYSSTSNIHTGGDIKGEFTVYVRYLADQIDTHEGNIVVRNNLRDWIYVPVRGKTQSSRDPIITWNIPENLRANTTYTNFVVSTNKESGLHIETSSNKYLKVTEVDGVYVLETALDEDNEPISDLTITVWQDETTNFDSVPHQTKTVNISPRVDVCLPILYMSADSLERMRVNSKETYAWYNTTNPEVSETFFLHPVKYSQYKGIGLGSWRDGFTGLTWEKIEKILTEWEAGVESFEWENKYIDLSFTGVPDSLFFSTQVQTVSFFFNFKWRTVEATTTHWKIYESVDGNFGNKPKWTGEGATTFNVPLSPETRYIRIEYDGNFTGFIQNLKITRDRYIKPSKEKLTFGYDDQHPLQEPQLLRLDYSSIGSCNDPENIIVESATDVFYVNEHGQLFAGIDDIGYYDVYVRCTDIGKSDVLKFKVGDDVLAEVKVNSVEPKLESNNVTTEIFQTGTESSHEENTPYRGITTYDFAECFNGSTAIFDTLYIYGVSASAPSKRREETSWNGLQPAIDLENGNVQTPCFVYAKDQNDDSQYIYERTFDAATTTLNISTTDAEKKLAFMGYKPAKLNDDPIPAIKISGNEPASIYLDSTEILASGAVLELNDVIDTIYARGNNILTSNSDATIKFIAPSTEESSELVIEDNWIDAKVEPSGFVALNAAVEKPSIQLNSANDSVIIRGSQLQLQNAKKMAIARMDGETEKVDGKVHIYDGTISGEDILGLPYNSIIDGGTFNQGTVKVYNNKGQAKRPRNSRRDLLARWELTKSKLESEFEWYGQNYLTLDNGKVHPMLLDTNLCIFYGGNGTSGSDESNWNKLPSTIDDEVWIRHHIEINDTLIAKSIIIEGGDTVSISVAPTGGIVVGDGGIEGSTVDNLILKADCAAESKTRGMTGFLRISPEYTDTMPHATVELFSKAYYDPNSNDKNNTASWQYVGIPIDSKDLAKTFFANSRIYSWQEASGEWINDRKTLVMTPFIGYCTSQYRNENGMLITFKGQLVNRKDQEVLKLSYTPESAEPGLNVFANSYSAPIDITKIDVKDFIIGDDDDATIHLFNTGSRIDISNQEGVELDAESVEAAGQYIPIPVGSANDMKKRFNCPTVIAPMQGFFVKTTKKGSLTLRYEDVVWRPAPANTPMRSRRKTELEEDESVSSSAMKVTLSSNGWKDRVYLLESEQYSTSFEKGIDARKMESGDFNIFVVADDKRLAVNATNSITNTHIGVRTGEEMYYTMIFTNLYGDTEWSLLDTETNEMTDIEEGFEYSFYAEPNTEIEGRFIIVERAQVPTTPTGIDGAEVDTKVQKFIKDNQLFVLKNGVLYNAQGKVVR